MQVIEIIPQAIQNKDYRQFPKVPVANERVISEELEQYNFLRKTTRYCYFFNTHYLSVAESDVHGNWSDEQVIDLRFLNQQPETRITIPVATLVTSFILFLISYIGLSFLEINWRLAICPALLGLLFLTFAPRLSSIRSVWTSEFGHANLLELYYNLPNRDEFSKFSELIKTKIRHSHQSLKNNKERLVAEMLEHRRLLDSKLIDQKEYEQAKKFILQEHEKIYPLNISASQQPTDAKFS